MNRKKFLHCRLVLFHTWLLLSVSPHSGFCQPAITLNEQFYTVTGQTSAEIRRNLNRNSPVRVDGRPFDAFTRWHVSWSFSYKHSSTECFIEEVSTRLEIEQIMPQLISPVPQQLKRKWDAYITALRHHEMGHRVFGNEAAADIENRLQNLRPRSECATLEKFANEAAAKIIQKYIAKEKQYDSRSDYGSHDGAVFP